MKKTFLTTAIIFYGLITFAQVGTDLQFSQIINSQTSGGSVAIGTVPSGKIWKLVGFSFGCTIAGGNCYISGTGVSTFLRSIGANGVVYDVQLPIFFKENLTLTLYAYCGGNDHATISIIEYTVLP